MLLETIPGVLLEAFCQGKLFYRFCDASMIRVSNLRSLAAIIKGVLIFILKIVSWCYTIPAFKCAVKRTLFRIAQ